METPYYKHDGNCWRFILSEDDSVKNDEFWITFCCWCAGYYLAGSNIKPNDIEWDKWGFRISDRLMDSFHAGKLITDIGQILFQVSTIMANADHYGDDKVWYMDFEWKLAKELFEEKYKEMEFEIKHLRKFEEAK